MTSSLKQSLGGFCIKPLCCRDHHCKMDSKLEDLQFQNVIHLWDFKLWITSETLRLPLNKNQKNDQLLEFYWSITKDPIPQRDYTPLISPAISWRPDALSAGQTADVGLWSPIHGVNISSMKSSYCVCKAIKIHITLYSDIPYIQNNIA